jgi:DNA end-binding protein Ku
MARSIWTGVISFGLVSVPVALYSATREHEVSFHQFEKDTADRIRYQRVNERTGKQVDYDDIVKGAEVSDDKYVMLDPEELDSIAPGRSRSLDIHAFVDLAEIDPIYFQKAYYLGPGSEETAKTYALLREAIRETNRAAVGTLVMRGKEYLTAIRPVDNVLVLHTMFFADEVRDPGRELDGLPGCGEAVVAGAGHGHPADRVDGRALEADRLPRHLYRPGEEADRCQEEGCRDHRRRRGAGGHRRRRSDGGASPQRRGGQESANAGR